MTLCAISCVSTVVAHRLVSGWSRPSPACLQIGPLGFMGLWGQQCHSNGLRSCGGCEGLLFDQSAILLILSCTVHMRTGHNVLPVHSHKQATHVQVLVLNSQTEIFFRTEWRWRGNTIRSVHYWFLSLTVVTEQRANMINIDMAVWTHKDDGAFGDHSSCLKTKRLFVCSRYTSLPSGTSSKAIAGDAESCAISGYSQTWDVIKMT